MNIQVKHAALTREGQPDRVRLRKALKLEPYLAQREAFSLGSDGIHCELYTHAVDAPTIVFLPGIGTYCEIYGEMLAKLSAKGFNVVGIDLPGHGYSDGSRGLYTVAQVSDTVSMVIDHLESRFHGPFAIFGYSIGATLGLAAAEQDSRVKALLCGTLLLPNIAPDMFHEMGWQWTHASAFFFPYMRVPLRMIVDFEQLLASHPAGSEVNKDPLIVFDYPLKTLSSAFSHRAGVVKNRYPFKSAIIHGERDEVLPLVYSKRVIRECEQPFDLLVMENATHMVPWLRTDQLVDMATDWFLSNL